MKLMIKIINIKKFKTISYMHNLKFYIKCIIKYLYALVNI